MKSIAESPQVETIFLSKNYTIESRRFSNNSAIFVSFMLANRKPQPFGVNVFDKYSLNVVYVICTGPHWYQYPDTEAATSAIAAYTKGFSKVITYGTSMGAYAALLFSRPIGAHAVLSFSPQYSLDPQKVPFEKRWRDHLSEINELHGFVSDNMETGLILDGQVIIMYDPLDDDSKHVALLRNIRPLSEVVLPFSKHRSLRVLSEVGLASQILRSIVDTEIDTVQLRSSFRALRRGSATYMAYLARHLEKFNKQSAKTAALLAARHTKDDDFEMYEANFKILSRLEAKYDSSIFLAGMFRSRYYLTQPRSFGDILKYSNILQEFSRVDEARVSLLKHISADDHDRLQLYDVLLLWLGGKKEEAIVKMIRLLVKDNDDKDHLLMSSFIAGELGQSTRSVL